MKPRCVINMFLKPFQEGVKFRDVDVKKRFGWAMQLTRSAFRLTLATGYRLQVRQTTTPTLF